ncbi:MAG: Rrf2 family transcriptional regulator [Candidatus Abyssobacteria bacterium SURF_17]|uniref:Rrf2 family transcriptional regulator n=1 Tax=Candidatus Abyssobacteria bacterium SURF_17 TaxID=2093361 RepID=A0A419F947_9BACT|nr:MAG: Rrf2 family transcriptional regulator [Candidatus Abyssubacteria bacterium SURF_17]
MKISAKGDYACRALLELALNHGSGSPVHVTEIAERQGIPRKYLVQILVMLKGAGLVKSKRGIEGGYLLSRAPSEITLGEVVRIVDGPLLPLKCSDEDTSTTCERKPICGFHPIWEEVRGSISHIVDNLTYEDICKRTREAAQMYYI